MGVVFRIFIVWGMWDGGGVNRGRRVVISLVACGVVAVVLTLVWPREREPVYKGRKLSEWIPRQPPWRQDLQAEAIRAIGTNAVPFLVEWIAYESPAWRKRLTASTKGLDIRLWELLGDRKAGRATYAAQAFMILGPQGNPGIPKLLGLLRSTQSDVAMRALVALDAIGIDAVPAVFSALTNQPARGPFTVYWLALAMKGLGTNASLVVPAVLRCLSDADNATAATAAIWLGNLGAESEVVVPVLADAVRSGGLRVRGSALLALGRIGRGARSAVPVLVEALTNSEMYVRALATNSLRMVAPEVLQGDEVR
jgi:hypothetical protein